MSLNDMRKNKSAFYANKVHQYVSWEIAKSRSTNVVDGTMHE
jgi:hypothetical protein